jgi:5,5'-dehydrodivanillate O-demethylase
MNLAYGIVEPEGIRCPYHGWMFDHAGYCVEQPCEPPSRCFKDRVALRSYAVRELGGLIFGYLGPEPAPVLPRWDLFAWENVTRLIRCFELPCNWLQCLETSLDPVHFQWLHHYWGRTDPALTPQQRAELNARTAARGRGRQHARIGFDRFEYGIIRRRLHVGADDTEEWWRIGHPIVFPNILRVGSERQHIFQIFVPMDDTNTLQFVYSVDVPEPGQFAPVQVQVPWRQESVHGADGRLKTDDILSQDQAAWILQGSIADRSAEHLGASDVGVIFFRSIFEEQIRIVQTGGDPLNVQRIDRGVIVLPQEHSYYPGDRELGGPFRDQLASRPQVEAVLV